jgi:hypothetical protein
MLRFDAHCGPSIVSASFDGESVHEKGIFPAEAQRRRDFRTLTGFLTLRLCVSAGDCSDRIRFSSRIRKALA